MILYFRHLSQHWQLLLSALFSETEEDYGKWIYYEGELTTGSEICTAGIMISGGFLTASIDDITVRKMKKMVVSFDSLGGTPVGSLETFENQYVVAPIEPEKEGYYFGGWYTEKNLKNLFDFNNTPITKNITLYARWIKIRYKDVTTYETEEITNPLPIENPDQTEFSHYLTVQKFHYTI